MSGESLGALLQYEEVLEDLLLFIRGEGPYSMLGTGIHTYPGREDESNERLYADCLILEDRGLIRRHFEEPGHVIFMPANSCADARTSESKRRS